MARPKMEEPDVEEARTRLLDAAKRCHERGGLDAMGMVDVARDADVARSTVYRYFANRDELLLALVDREIRATAQQIESSLATVDEPANYIVEGMILALRELPRRSLLVDLFVSDHFALARSEVWGSPTIVKLGHDFMSAVIEPARSRGLLRAEPRPEILVEWVYRVFISFVTLPSKWAADDEQLRSVLHAMLIPVLLERAPKPEKK